MSKRTLKGLTWDHPRGFDPLVKAAALFEQQHPDTCVEWHRRSLQSFGDEPLESLAAQFDLVLIDHPFCGQAAKKGCLRDLSELFPAAFIDALRADSVGPSTEAYRYQGALFALPTDAAAHVAAYRPDLLRELGAELPRRFDDTLALAKAARARGFWIAQPLCPTDAACTTLTLCAALGCTLDEDGAVDLDANVAAEALRMIAELRAVALPASLDWNPIQTYDAMVQTGQIVYVPFAFGYSNYARTSCPVPIRFANLAGPGADPSAGSVLGGAGCAITTSCRDVEAALLYLRFLHGVEHQKGAHFDAGGQPGLRSAWLDDRVNQLSGSFFAETLLTLEKSYRRPRFAGFVPFLSQAGHAIHTWLHEQGDLQAVVDNLRRSYDEARCS